MHPKLSVTDAMNVYAMKTKETDINITKEVDVKKNEERSRCQKWSKIACLSFWRSVQQNPQRLQLTQTWRISARARADARRGYISPKVSAVRLYSGLCQPKKLNLSKLPASKIFAGCVHTDKGLCQGKPVMENSSKKAR